MKKIFIQTFIRNPNRTSGTPPRTESLLSARTVKPFPGDRVPAVNMAEQLLETVERLQSRIQDSPEPRKVTADPVRTDGFVFVNNRFDEKQPKAKNVKEKFTNGCLNAAFTDRRMAPSSETDSRVKLGSVR